MASYTPNLDLLKKNPLTEGSDTFNITTMLNDNWDKIDSKIGNPAELWVWEKKNYTPGYPLLSDPIGKQYLYYLNSGSMDSSTYVEYEYSDSVEVSKDGQVSLVNPSSTRLYKTSASTASGWDVLEGKYFRYISKNPNSSALSTQIANGTIYYWPTGSGGASAEITGAYFYVTGLCSVSGVPPVFSHISYVTSPSSTTYPEDGQSGSYWYTRLGQMGEGMTKIETGSYVGTGTHGSSNPNSLTFGFVPKFFVVQNASASDTYLLYAIYGTSLVTPQTNTTGNGVGLTWNGNTVSWTAPSAGVQKNVANNVYNYIAFG